MDQDLLQEMINEAGFLAGWEMVSDVSIDCPCGYTIELDGECPDGCVSAVRQLGMI